MQLQEKHETSPMDRTAGDEGVGNRRTARQSAIQYRRYDELCAPTTAGAGDAAAGKA